MEGMDEEKGNILVSIVTIVEATENEAVLAIEANGRIVFGLRLQHHSS